MLDDCEGGGEPEALLDLTDGGEVFRRDVLAGLTAPQKAIPAKYLYDARGSALFEAICELPEYYPTRTELGLLSAHAAEMAALLGAGALVEFGSGASVKVRLLLDALRGAAAYVPVDIARDQLLAASAALAQAYPQVRVLPVCADYTRRFALPGEVADALKVGFFPGSTIGNFDPAAARSFLAKTAQTLGAGSGLLIGVDLKKTPEVLHAAYNDARGVTAAFNKNLLARINGELGGSFDAAAFDHYAPYVPALGRVEMHLVSRRAQTVEVAGRTIAFEEGESIHTESSYKYTVSGFHALAASAGWRAERCWPDEARLFSVHFLRALD